MEFRGEGTASLLAPHQFERYRTEAEPVESSKYRNGPRHRAVRWTPAAVFSAFFCFVLIAELTGPASACEPADVQPPLFPLRTEPGKRYLEDSSGKPFFIQGDTAWSLIAELTEKEAELYLVDRKARGFNTILVNLIEREFASKAPANIKGEMPFTNAGDFTTPNETYFAHAERVLKRACDLGFLVLLTPSYAGYEGGPEGWYREMVGNGPDRLRIYGEYLGQRFAHLDNIVWVEGGDYNPPDKDLVRAIVDGISKYDPEALHTAHNSPEWAALDYWDKEPWLAINNIYTYEPVFQDAVAQYARSEKMPFFLMESAYEGEHGADTIRIRMQAYQAVLSGAAGQIFGNNPIWHFSGPGLYETSTDWKQALDSPGARSMEILYKLLSATEWWLLEPDIHSRFLVSGHGAEDRRAVAAAASNGSFALAYIPTARPVNLDLSRLAGNSIAAEWIDPSSGDSAPVEGSPFPPLPQTFLPPPTNRSGSSDWILKLTSVTEKSEGK